MLGTADYLPGVRVLVRSLARSAQCVPSLLSWLIIAHRQAHALRTGGAAFPLVVLVPGDLAQSDVQPLLDDAARHGASNAAFDVHIRRVGRMQYADGWTTAGCRYWWLNAAGHYAELEHSLNKLWAFDLVDYAAVVYLDADVLPLKAPDELFAMAQAWRRGDSKPLTGGDAAPADRPPFFAAAPDWGRHGGDAPGFNAGVFVGTPCASLRPQLLALAASPTHARHARCHRRGTADQPLLQYYFGLDAVTLPVRYNLLQPGLVARPWLAAVYPPVMLHFTKHKPWQLPAESAEAQQPGMRDWMGVCALIGCCDPPASCSPPPVPLPRGPHWKRSAEAKQGAKDD